MFLTECHLSRQSDATPERRGATWPPTGDHGRMTLLLSDTGYEIHAVVVGPMDNNVFIVRCTGTGDAVLIDAANEHDRLLELCEELGVRRVIETHGHWDHIQAVPAVRDAGYDVGVTAADAGMLPAYDDILEDDSIIEVGHLRLATIATPGHTPGSMCFQLEGSPLLFSGDTLFPGGPGNTSFEGGDFRTIIEAIDTRLFTRPADTIVLPGHGSWTTIGTERPHLQEWVDRGW
jgi:glyoxylase-like metal-dependent hydrolase (beta-lactamase superfamily II)